jgi:hypothetical protein
MDDDSLNFGSPTAGTTPNSNSILAQPPLQEETASPSGQEGGARQGEGQGVDGRHIPATQPSLICNKLTLYSL